MSMLSGVLCLGSRRQVQGKRPLPLWMKEWGPLHCSLIKSLFAKVRDMAVPSCLMHTEPSGVGEFTEFLLLHMNNEWTIQYYILLPLLILKAAYRDCRLMFSSFPRRENWGQTGRDIHYDSGLNGRAKPISRPSGQLISAHLLTPHPLRARPLTLPPPLLLAHRVHRQSSPDLGRILPGILEYEQWMSRVCWAHLIAVITSIPVLTCAALCT